MMGNSIHKEDGGEWLFQKQQCSTVQIKIILAQKRLLKYSM